MANVNLVEVVEMSWYILPILLWPKFRLTQTSCNVWITEMKIYTSLERCQLQFPRIMRYSQILHLHQLAYANAIVSRIKKVLPKWKCVRPGSFYCDSETTLLRIAMQIDIAFRDP